MKVFLLLCPLLSSIFALNHTLFNRNTTKSVNYEMIKAIHFVFDEIYFKEFQTVTIIDCVASTTDHYFRDFKNAVHTDTNITGSQFNFRTGNNTYIEPSPNQLRIKNLILLDTLESYKKFHKLLTRNRFNFRGQFLFAFIHGYIGAEDSQQILSMVWSKGVYNVNLLYEQDKIITMTTMQLFRARSCNDMQEILVDKFANGTFLKENPAIIFPKIKFSNLQRCSVKVVTFERCPALCFEKRGKQRVYWGYDWDIIRELGKRLNFTRKSRHLSGEQKWGTVLENGTASGAVKKLVDKEFDIGIGSFFLRESQVKILDTSVTYFTVPIVMVIPPAPKLTAFEKLLQPFEALIWVLLMLTFLVGFLVIVIINYKYKHIKIIVYGRNVQSPIMNMLAAIFGLQQSKLPQKNFARFILLMFLFFCLVNRNVYQGVLYLFLQSDGRHKEVQSINEMVEKDFRFYVYKSYADFVDNKSEIYKRRILVKRDSELPFSKKVNESLKAAYMTPLIDVVNINRKNQGNFSLKVCAEQVSVLNTVFLFARDFYLKPAIDEKLRQFDDAGLLAFWIEKYIDKRFLNVKAGVPEPKTLNLEHLFGVFNVMLIGHAVAIIVFILEIIVFKISQARKRQRQLIDSRIGATLMQTEEGLKI